MEYTSMSINQLTITPKKLISINELAKEAGFNYSVLISEKLLNKITKSGYENLNVFLKVCAKQLKISLTDSKNWKKTRLFYPMECFNGSLNPEEAVPRGSGYASARCRRPVWRYRPYRRSGAPGGARAWSAHRSSRSRPCPAPPRYS